MKSVNVCLNTVEKVKDFVNAIAMMEGDFDLASDRYVVDAKSIMGIFSLDLSKVLRLDIHSEAAAEKAMPLLAPFVVE